MNSSFARFPCSGPHDEALVDSNGGLLCVGVLFEDDDRIHILHEEPVLAYVPSYEAGAAHSERTHVSLRIYNVAVKRVSSGVYFYRLEADGFSQTRKLVLLR